ncbi:uncharacterized protein A4U43_C02F21350 [Asparagus officinalis]|uniref:Uncharacterized protein n=1 Tax=Asparagus officinalis TaxID=4686 RepID=A0A5P1FLS6_ASPOF|nr:uncharacterized protein A4U43_C02F21350 [Asparagus officinalis]
MARAILSAAGLVALIKRRGYSSVSTAGKVSRGKTTESTSTATPIPTNPASSSSWIPDPVTGYYRPGNKKAETDAAEMRARRTYSTSRRSQPTPALLGARRLSGASVVRGYLDPVTGRSMRPR